MTSDTPPPPPAPSDSGPEGAPPRGNSKLFGRLVVIGFGILLLIQIVPMLLKH